LGGYFIADVALTQKFQISNLYDGSTWSALNFSTADASPDNLNAVFANHGELWLFGDYTTEVWYQNGQPLPGAFSRVAYTVLDYGIAARYSVAKGSNTVFWLATQRNNDSGEFWGVAVANGYSVQKISTPAIDYQISQYSVISDAFGYTFTNESHENYVLCFPTQGVTWVYDMTVGQWYEWSTYVGSPYATGRHISNCYCYFNGNHYVGDYASGKIYKMSSTMYTDNGLPISSVRISDNVNDQKDLNNVFFSKVQIDAEVGTTPLGTYPPNFLQITKDIAGGYIYVTINGQTEYFGSSGNIAQDMGGIFYSIYILGNPINEIGRASCRERV
jgi:hypothetical protein